MVEKRPRGSLAPGVIPEGRSPARSGAVSRPDWVQQGLGGLRVRGSVRTSSKPGLASVLVGGSGARL